MNELHDTLAAAFLTVLAVGVAAAGSAHAVLNKRDVRAAIGWVGLMWLVPFAGVALYGLFGINRIRRRATGLRPQRLHPRPPGGEPVPQPRLDVTLPAGAGHLAAIGTLVDAIAPSPLTDGNAITPIADGVEAYRAMLDAIEGARQTIGMATYIFDNDAAGRRFAETLAAAVRRGVAVRVLIDGAGARYSFPTMTSVLAECRCRWPSSCQPSSRSTCPTPTCATIASC